jgi:hypothetical protein
MPALNFQARWADAVEIGARHANGVYMSIGTTIPKRTTIRKWGRAWEGQTLYLYTGQRTPQCRKLGEVLCLFVTPFTISKEGVPRLGGYPLNMDEIERLARLDTAGQLGGPEFIEFFRDAYGLPFDGGLYGW